MKDESDASLLQRYVKNGDSGAFDTLVARYRGLVYSTCRRAVGDSAGVEDLVQAVFLVLLRHAPRLHGEQRLAAWLYKTCLLVARNHARQERTRQRQEKRLMEEVQRQQDQDQSASWTEADSDLNRALDSLSSADREAILLRYTVGLSVGEVGQTLRISEGAAQMRLTRALERLRQWFARQGIAIPVVALTALLADQGGTAAHSAPIPHDIEASETAKILAKGALTQMRNQMLLKTGLMAAVVVTASVSASNAVIQITSPKIITLTTPLTSTAQPTKTQQLPSVSAIASAMERESGKLRTAEGIRQVEGPGIVGLEVHWAYASARNYWDYKSVSEQMEPDGKSRSLFLYDGTNAYQLSTIPQANGTVTNEASRWTGESAADYGQAQMTPLSFGYRSANDFPITRHLREGKYTVTGMTTSTEYGNVYVVEGEDSLIGPHSIENNGALRTVPPRGIDTRAHITRRFWIAPQFGWMAIQEEEGTMTFNGKPQGNPSSRHITKIGQYGNIWVPLAATTEQNGVKSLTLTSRDVRVNATPEKKFTWIPPAGVIMVNAR